MLFFITFVVLLASAQAKFYEDCGSKLASVELVGVSDCAEDSTECVLRRGRNATISIDFTPTSDVDSLTTEVHGIIMNLPVPFPLPQPDACRNNGLTCPLKAGEKYSYRTSLPVMKSYPQLGVAVKWELKNENEEDLVCVLIKAKIK